MLLRSHKSVSGFRSFREATHRGPKGSRTLRTRHANSRSLGARNNSGVSKLAPYYFRRLPAGNDHKWEDGMFLPAQPLRSAESGYTSPRGGYCSQIGIAIGVGAAAGSGISCLALRHRGRVTGCVGQAEDGLISVNSTNKQTYSLLDGPSLRSG